MNKRSASLQVWSLLFYQNPFQNLSDKFLPSSSISDTLEIKLKSLCRDRCLEEECLIRDFALEGHSATWARFRYLQRFHDTRFAEEVATSRRNDEIDIVCLQLEREGKPVKTEKQSAPNVFTCSRFGSHLDLSPMFHEERNNSSAAECR